MLGYYIRHRHEAVQCFAIETLNRILVIPHMKKHRHDLKGALLQNLEFIANCIRNDTITPSNEFFSKGILRTFHYLRDEGRHSILIVFIILSK